MNGTDDNTNQDGTGPFSDNGWGGSEGSEDVAVEFAVDPIEKTRRRNQPHRAIPDRAKLEDMREQALNNFMLCPWVIPSPEDEND